MSILMNYHWRLRIASLVCLLLVAFGLVFILPWYVPVKGPVESESYTFGFSNLTAQLGVALTLLALFAWRILTSHFEERDEEMVSRFIIIPERSSLLVSATLLTCIVVTLSVIGWWWYMLPFGYFGECTYFLTRLDMMTLGEVPLHDFGYGYGLAMLWIPWLIQKVSFGLIAVDTAYLLTLLLFFAAGILAVAHILRFLNISDRARVFLLIFSTLATLNIMLGVMYTALRFIYPVWVVLVLFNSLRTLTTVKIWVLAWCLTLFGLFVSPDSGLVTSVALLVGFSRLWQAGDSRAPKLLSSLFVALLLWLCLFGLDYFNMIFSFGGGAGNFPIFPAPYILALLLSACWVLPKIASAGWSGCGTIAPICMALLFALGLYLPAALGRCDPGHVLFNGLGIFLFAMAVAIFQKSRSMLLLVCALAIIALVTHEISFWSHYSGLVENALGVRQAIASSQKKIQIDDDMVKSRLLDVNPSNRFHWEKKMPFSPDLLELLRYRSVAAPVGVSEDIDRFLKVSGRYVPEYFVPPLVGTFTPKDVKKKADLLNNCEFLLLPESSMVQFTKVDRVTYAKFWSKFLGGLFVCPIHLNVVNEPFLPIIEVVQQLLPHFNVEGRFRNYLILHRNN
jgi:hypothetical protein